MYRYCTERWSVPVRPRDMKREPRMVMTAVSEMPTLDWINSIFLQHTQGCGINGGPDPFSFDGIQKSRGSGSWIRVSFLQKIELNIT